MPNQNKAKATTLYADVIRGICVQSDNFVKKDNALLLLSDYIKMQEDYLNLITQSSLAETEYQRQKENKNIGLF